MCSLCVVAKPREGPRRGCSLLPGRRTSTGEENIKKLAIIAALSLAVTVSITQTAFAAGGWTQVSVPSTGYNVSLLGAIARTNSDAWAVGQQFVAAGQPQAPAVAYH